MAEITVLEGTTVVAEDQAGPLVTVGGGGGNVLSVNGRAGAVSGLAEAVDVIPLTQKAAANGVAPLDANSLIPSQHLPPVALGDVFTVASQAAMLALAAQSGDMAVRTDLDPDGFFILVSNSPGTLADWRQIQAPGAVLSVNGQTGVISVTPASIGAETPAGAQQKVDTHVNDTSAAHADSAVSVNPSGLVVIQGADTDVHAALARLDAAVAAGPVGFPVGGDLTGTLPNPTIANGKVGNAQAKAADPFQADKIANPAAVTPINASGGAAPAFTSGWANFAPFTCGFWLDEMTGLVRFRGIANFSGDPPAASIMFTLPSTHWPAQRVNHVVQVIHNAVVVTALLNVLETTGDVWVGGNFNTNCFVYLDNVSFRVAGI